MPFTISDFDLSPFGLLTAPIAVHPNLWLKPNITVHVNLGWSFTWVIHEKGAETNVQVAVYFLLFFCNKE